MSSIDSEDLSVPKLPVTANGRFTSTHQSTQKASEQFSQLQKSKDSRRSSLNLIQNSFSSKKFTKIKIRETARSIQPDEVVVLSRLSNPVSPHENRNF